MIVILNETDKEPNNKSKSAKTVAFRPRSDEIKLKIFSFISVASLGYLGLLRIRLVHRSIFLRRFLSSLPGSPGFL